MGVGAACAKDCAAAYQSNGGAVWYDCTTHHGGRSEASCPSHQREADFAEVEEDARESEVRFSPSHFILHRVCFKDTGATFTQSYNIGKELGAGQTAIVYEAVTVPREDTDEDGYCHLAGHCQGVIPPRKVALKQYNVKKSSMLKQELRTLSVAGTHPHVVRLLESYQGGGDPDALVLEHCDGGDLYELYAANHGCRMPELFVAQMMKQVLLAIEHLVSVGIEHRDVKPENLLLYGPHSLEAQCAPHLKLSDFGWAVVLQPGQSPPEAPNQGVGSLWYAPPELNPPQSGYRMKPVTGRSDVWSVGVIAFLLLCGHNPFNTALKVREADKREAEVIRLVAMGSINKGTRSWSQLTDVAKTFTCKLLVPDPISRPTASQALQHEFIIKGKEESCATSPIDVQNTSRKRWEAMDCLQKLGFLAFARAVAEPELAEIPTVQSFLEHQAEDSERYLEDLAVELAVAAGPSWFQQQANFLEALRLAFLYLDCDGDGILSARDLAKHIAVGKASTDRWIAKWSRDSRRPLLSTDGLDFVDFRKAMSASSRQADEAGFPWWQGAPLLDTSPGTDDEKDAYMEQRMQAFVAASSGASFGF